MRILTEKKLELTPYELETVRAGLLRSIKCSEVTEVLEFVCFLSNFREYLDNIDLDEEKGYTKRIFEWLRLFNKQPAKSLLSKESLEGLQYAVYMRSRFTLLKEVERGCLSLQSKHKLNLLKEVSNEKI